MGLRIPVGAYFHFSCALGRDHTAGGPDFSCFRKRGRVLVFVFRNHDLLIGQWSVGGGDQSAHCRAAPAGANASPEYSARGLARWPDSRSFVGCGAPKPAMGSHPAYLPCPNDHLWSFALPPKVPSVSSKSASAEHGQYVERICFAGIAVRAVADGDGWVC